MIEFTIYTFLVLALGCVAGWFTREIYAKRVLSEYYLQAQEKSNYNVIHVVITKDNNTFLVHNADTGEFLAQGSTHQELFESLTQRFSNTIFTVATDNLKEVGYEE